MNFNMAFLFIFAQCNDQIITLNLCQDRNTKTFTIDPKLDSLSYQALVDTGSDKFVAKGWACNGKPLTKLKVKDNPNCFAKTKQKFKQSYLQGGISGEYCIVKMKLDKVQKPIKIGVFDKCDPSMENNQAIAGLFLQKGSFIQRLIQNKFITKNQFTMTIQFFGQLILGSADLTLIDFKRPLFCSSFAKLTEYAFPGKAIMLGSQEHTYKNLIIHIDTGSTLSTIPYKSLTGLLALIKKIVAKPDDCTLTKSGSLQVIRCETMTESQKQKFPSISFKFQQVFTLDPNNEYFQCHAKAPKFISCRINFDSIKNDPNFSLMGINFMNNMVITVYGSVSQMYFGYKKK